MDPSEAKRRSRGFSVDMSPEAVLRRLEIVAGLRDLGLALANAKPLPESNDSPARVRRSPDGGSTSPSDESGASE